MLLDICQMAMDGGNSKMKKVMRARRITCQLGFSQRGTCLKGHEEQLLAGT